MITKKDFYYSSITDEIYESLKAAETAEQDIKQSKEYTEKLLNSFYALQKEYIQKKASVEERYEPALRNMIRQLQELNVVMKTDNPSNKVRKIRVSVHPASIRK